MCNMLRFSCLSISGNCEVLNLFVDGLAAYAEQACGLGLVPACFLQGLNNGITATGWYFLKGWSMIFCIIYHFSGQMINRDRRTVTEYKGMFNGVFQLPDVPLPGVAHEDIPHLIRYAEDVLVVTFVEQIAKVINKQRDIFPSVP